MATLRELRKKAGDLGVTYEKTTAKEVLEEMIAEKLAEAADTAEKETPPAPAVERRPVARTPVVVSKAPAEEQESSEPVLAAKAFTREGEGFGSFEENVSINDENLDEEFIRQPGLYGHYAKMEAIAQGKLLSAKARLDVIQAEVYRTLRTKYEEGGEKFTEKKLEMDVVTHKNYKAAMAQYIKAKEDADLCRAARDALSHRRDMLIQLGSSKRLQREQEGIAILAGKAEKARAVMGS
jgi:hypothetical protein